MLNYCNNANVAVHHIFVVKPPKNDVFLLLYVQDGVISVWFDGKILMDVGKRVR